MCRLCKLLLLTILTGLTALPAAAQLTLKEGSLRLVPNDTEILLHRNTPEKRMQITDDNGNLCSLIKITTENMTAEDRRSFMNPRNRETDLATFIVKVETDHVGEIWLFISPGANYMILKHADYGNCKFDFNAMGLTLEAGKVYEATIVGDRKVYESILMRNKGGAAEEEETIQYLIITASPADAEIYVDGEDAGTGEVSMRLPVGMRHTWRVEAPMHHTEEGSVELTAEERMELQVTLKPEYGYLTILSTPESGATVYIDDELMGNTPLESQKMFRVGEHKLRLVKAQYKPVQQTVTVVEGERVTASIPLSANFAQLTVNASADVQLYVDGQRVGQGSWSGRLAEGSHLIEGRKDKCTSSQLEYKAKRGTTQTIDLPDPKPIYGRLEVNCSPANATVTLDGKELGKTPNIFNNLTVGEYDLVISKPGYRDYSQRITIGENEKRFVDVRLEMIDDIPVIIAVQPKVRHLKMTVDGREMPFTYEQTYNGKLNVGKRHVELSYDGLSEFYDIDVSPTRNYFLLDVTGTLSLSARPLTSPKVYVDGEEKGVAPQEFRLPVGRHSFYLEGYNAKNKPMKAEAKITLAPGDHLTQDFRLKRHYGYSLITWQGSMTAPVGFSYAYCGTWGGYVRYQQSLDSYQADLAADESTGLPKSYEGMSRQAFSAGLMYAATNWMYLALGGGYDRYNVYYKVDGKYTSSGQEMLALAQEVAAPQVELSAFLRLGWFVLSAGYDLTLGSELFGDVHVGVGFAINHH